MSCSHRSGDAESETLQEAPHVCNATSFRVKTRMVLVDDCVRSKTRLDGITAKVFMVFQRLDDAGVEALDCDNFVFEALVDNQWNVES